MAGNEGEIVIFPAGSEDMISDPFNYAVHRIIGDEMNFMSTLCEIFCPTLGMDAAAIGDEEEDQRNRLSYSENYKFIT